MAQVEQVERVSVDEARGRAHGDQALLVCAYDDEAKCKSVMLEGAISLKELQRRLPEVPKDRELIFYCS